MLFFYVMLVAGVLFVIIALLLIIAMYFGKDYSILGVGKTFGALLIGGLFLLVTLPSLKYMVLKEYDIVSGKCVIEIVSSGRHSEADFNMLDTDETYSFVDVPLLDAYGKSIPYYCEVTVTKDHMFEISYKIFDIKTRKLILTSE